MEILLRHSHATVKDRTPSNYEKSGMVVGWFRADFAVGEGISEGFRPPAVITDAPSAREQLPPPLDPPLLPPTEEWAGADIAGGTKQLGSADREGKRKLTESVKEFPKASARYALTSRSGAVKERKALLAHSSNLHRVFHFF